MNCPNCGAPLEGDKCGDVLRGETCREIGRVTAVFESCKYTGKLIVDDQEFETYIGRVEIYPTSDGMKRKFTLIEI